ncbi:MAG: insulinase family protein [Dysgonamonadaceae bacterium]|jgi:predicted Zn-dependent peptidase|nr:insulinase family protein [Dysgonamonadaceae bacterium]
MKIFKSLFFICAFALLSLNAGAQGLKAFKLPNGLSVFIWEDDKASDVFGMVAVNAGAKDDPAEYTGLAHYLEHLMFKGTDKIGALDWDKEKPVYEQIIAKYDEMADAADPVRKQEISKEINQLTQEAANYSLSNEFSALIESFGGENMNASTHNDYTEYHNSFPPGEVYKWLEIYSERLINPVFRIFQTELETVYEEYNRRQDERSTRESEFLMANEFDGHPYARPIIGLPEHLKNPRLSKLIQFYRDWYVPSNMALILAGNVKTNEVLPIIREKFGRLENRPAPEKKVYPETPLKGRKSISAKLTRYPEVILAFPGITSSSEDDIALDICTSLLSNSSQTGLINKLSLDGDLMAAGANSLSLLDRGVVEIYGIPLYDRNQGRFESLGSVEKMLLAELKKIKEGKIDEELVLSIKNGMIRNHELSIESNYGKCSAIADIFLNGKDMNRLLDYGTLVAETSMDKIKETASKYFGDNYLVFNLSEGKPEKGKELEKPKYEPIKPVRGVESNYAKEFKLLPVKYLKNSFADMNEVQSRQINDRSKLFYTVNPVNDIFSLTLKFGIGTEKMPKLEYAVSLMNNAGIMGQMDAQQVKRAFADLGATCRYYVNDSYLYVSVTGFDVNLEATCNLLTRQILLPKLDEKQMNNLQGQEMQSRRMEKDMTESLRAAMEEYILYGAKSDYIDRLTMDEVNELTVSNLTGEFQRATDYEAEIHYVGALAFDEAYNILSKNLPLKNGEKASTSPEIKELTSYPENTVFLLPNSDVKQSNITFYVLSDDYKNSIDPYMNAFNQYFGDGGLNGLVFQEIREYRSMAYSAYGSFDNPPLENHKTYFDGYVGTQGDKTLDAVDVYSSLLTDMPQYPERLFNLKSYLKGTASVEKPTFRNASQMYENWKRRGYTLSPAETNFPKYDALTFDQITGFYNENIKGRPIVIGIMGDPKSLDEKALSKYGKVVKLSKSKIFSEK